jgi:hypothetical protein
MSTNKFLIALSIFVIGVYFYFDQNTKVPSSQGHKTETQEVVKNLAESMTDNPKIMGAANASLNGGAPGNSLTDTNRAPSSISEQTGQYQETSVPPEGFVIHPETGMFVPEISLQQESKKNIPPVFQTLNEPPKGFVMDRTTGQMLNESDLLAKNAAPSVYVAVDHPPEGFSGLRMPSTDTNSANQIAPVYQQVSEPPPGMEVFQPPKK